MRFPRVLGVMALGLLALGGEARADDKADADALVRDGQALGNQGDYRGALAKFKAAALKFERAVNDCNIGAAYAELGQWPQAQLFLDRCRSRTSNADQRAFAEQRLAQVMTELGAGKFAAVEVVVEPAGAAFTVSSFAPDEKVLPPRVVWLAHGMSPRIRMADNCICWPLPRVGTGPRPVLTITGAPSR